jgi:LmbE family N-acetylglucosaminyl deacetylase
MNLQEVVMINSIIPIPEIMSARQILAIQPHYDDNDIGAGGTLALLRESGAEIHYLTVTDDLIGVLDTNFSPSQAREVLEREQDQAGEIIGVSSQIRLGYPDAGRYDYFDLRADMLKNMRVIKPDFVFAPDPWLAYESHRDHIQCGLAAASAANLVGLPKMASSDPRVDMDYQPHELIGVVFYYTSEPNTPVEVSAVHEKKEQAIRCYKAQFQEEDLEMLLQVIKAKESIYAQSQGMQLAEGLKVMAPIALHCGL